MKKILPLLLAALIATSCSHKASITELTHWQFQYQGEWLDATVPGCIHTDLMAHNLIPDPFYGTNEDSVQWVDDYDSAWTYRTFITYEEWEDYDSIDLVFDGLTFAHITLFSDKKIDLGFADNMFRQWRYSLPTADLGDTLMIEVNFICSGLNDFSGLEGLGYHLPDERAFTRTAPYMQGWDWGPKLNTRGLWQPVHLECFNQKRPEKKLSTPTSWNVELHQDKDSIGQSFTFYKDGKPFFAKGANWIPCHSFPILTPALKERYRYLLTSAKEAHFNMLRVWGGGIYEPDYFYDLCDSLGIMVWQDFNFSCALYPSDSAFLDNVQEEALQQVKRIAQHPCIVLWCGNNEVKNGWEDWGWQEQYKWTPEQIAQLQHGIDTLFGPNGILAQAVEQNDPLHRPYISSSPFYGWGHPECVTHGDSHYWGVWWGEEPFEMYKEKTGRFMSEFGFQSYPDYSTVCRYCPEDQRNIDSPTMKKHQKHGRGREIIDKSMLQYYGVDSKCLSLEDYCYVSQLLQAWGMGYGIVQHLLAQPHCMGTLYWQLDDCWPVASWSSIDYYGNWKALHYLVRDLYDDNFEPSQWEHRFQTFPKDLNLPAPRYRMTQFFNTAGTLSVTIAALTDLRDVMLQTEPHVDGHFEYNYFDIQQGQSFSTHFIPRDPKADLSGVKIKLKCLNEIYAKGR